MGWPRRIIRKRTLQACATVCRLLRRTEGEQLAYRNEFEAAFTLSRAEAQLEDPEIALHIAMGQHVIALCSDAYCPRTDASMGERRTFHLNCASAEIAEAICKVENFKLGDVDCYYRVISPAEPPAAPTDEEIPF